MKRIFAVLCMIILIMQSFVSCAPNSPKDIPTENQVVQAYKTATEASFWFRVCTIESDYAITKEYNGKTYAKVKRFETLDDLKAYLQNLFSDEIINEFLNYSSTQYSEIDGELYVIDSARGTDIEKGEETYSISNVSDDEILLNVEVELLDANDDFKVIGSETYEFSYKYINDKWVFATFPSVR